MFVRRNLSTGLHRVVFEVSSATPGVVCTSDSIVSAEINTGVCVGTPSSQPQKISFSVGSIDD